MRHTIRDFSIEVIDEPLQEHVVAWEKASRALQSEDAKPHLTSIVSSLEKVSIAHVDPAMLVNVFMLVSSAIRTVAEIIENNETLTLSSNRGVMVKAAITAGWLLSPQMTPSEVDKLPPWKVGWIAEKVGKQYMDAIEIPKN